MTDLIVIGGGASGFFTAIHYAYNNPDASIHILEKSDEILSKVKISGGGRCNVTHACFDRSELLRYYPRGSKFLKGPFFSFSTEDTMEWFESRGVPLKIEPDNRVFPVSDSSQSIIDCLIHEAKTHHITIQTGVGINAISKEADRFSLQTDTGETLYAKQVCLATGSSRKGHQLAESLGHSIVKPIPSLFTVKIKDPSLHELKGLSVPNVSVWVEGKKKQSQNGPLLITHWGLSGPSVIKLSAWQAETFHQANYALTINVDLLPDMSHDQTENSLTHFAKQSPKKQCIGSSLFSEIPQRFWSYLIEKSPIPKSATWGELAPKSIQNLSNFLKQVPFNVTGKSPFKDEFVTCGGVECSEISSKTMESTICPGFYVVGEALNIDGVTGGFNFQNAWTTGYLAGTLH